MLWAAMIVNASPALMFLLISFGTILGIAGTDLILPAIPAMPAALGGTAALAQMVLAAYAAGTLVGLLTFGELGARYSRRTLLVWSLSLFAVTSLLSAYAPTLEWLVILRFAQGAFGSAPAVFAPGFIHGLFPGDKAPSMFGRLGSIESLTPALAPIAGAYLMTVGGWQTSFFTLAGFAVLCAAGSWVYRQSLPHRAEARDIHQSYGSILSNGDFLRHGLSQALSLGSILTFVFGAPAVMTGALGMTIGSFILLQVCGIAFFILASNASNALARRYGTERMIMVGTGGLVFGFLLILLYTSLGGRSLAVLVPLWMTANGAFGIRGPIGFHQAIVASRGDHSRGAALVVAAILGITAGGTAAAAPFINIGWWPLALASSLAAILALLCLTLFGSTAKEEG
ncbi:MFS transporter [Sinorhizobium medicae]|uniref:MFS transporter n=1 Tax=Sinorhizobium medicae TaxID=110321 RepID=UPI001AAEFA68|nr:MFS transporter [Sinorhizobium medicae]MBO1960000.1 MFS transporter [Sinorhizobium medicae]WQO54759.1 MFS transporter [Sinorhizobium medicae]WQP40844.1 MFS transporter [Sinorhizobium medicae]